MRGQGRQARGQVIRIAFKNYKLKTSYFLLLSEILGYSRARCEVNNQNNGS